MEELKKGEKFGYLKIKERVVGGYKCICKCKKVVIVRSNDLTAGKVKSCGCYKSEKNEGRYKTWKNDKSS